MVDALEDEYSFVLRNGTSAPSLLAYFAIFFESVDTTTLPILDFLHDFIL